MTNHEKTVFVSFWISPNTRDFWLNGLGPHEIPLHKFTRLQPVANFIFISKNIFQCFNSIGPNKTQKRQKNGKTVFFFTITVFSIILNLIWDVWGCPGGRAWTIRRDSLELWQGLVLQDMGEVDFHLFLKYWKLTSSPNTSKLVLGPPDWSSESF